VNAVPGGAGGSWFEGADAPTRRDLDTCVHCGLCLTACPTYRTLKLEPDSPRGRIWLMRGLADGRIAPDDTLVAHLDGCLDCRACETVCPAGVPYGRMLEATRDQIEQRVRRPTPARTLAGLVLSLVLPHRERVHAAVDLLRMGQHGALGAWLRGAGGQLLPGWARRGLASTPELGPRAERPLALVGASLPHGARMREDADGVTFSPAGEPRGRVALHETCLMEAMFSHTHREAVRLMVIAGLEVVAPRAATCCGALHAHSGHLDEARDLARRNVRAFAGSYDFVVSHSAGCGAALREFGHLLGGAAEAAAFSAKVRDVSEVLAHYGLPPAPHALASPRNACAPLRVAMHDPCHLAHAQRVREAPRRLLRALPGVEFVELPDADWCCGSAGVYNLTQPEMANAQLDGKLDRIERVAPDVVIASNPGCLLHMQRGARERGSAVRIVHLLDVLGEAYPPPVSASHA
jgi:glycolate oxidase iron-sulfur subunit